MKKRLIIGAAATIILAGVVIFGSTQKTQPTAAVAHTLPTSPQPTDKQVLDAFPAMATPKKLEIPALGIDAPIEPVGITSDGAMDIPDSLTTAGWYQHGTAPGNPGKAVLAAHTGYPKRPTIFRALERATPGLTVHITDQNNGSAVFEVIEIKRYAAKDAPRHLIFGSSPTARLAIITCSGAWDAAQNSYAERLVLYAVRAQ